MWWSVKQTNAREVHVYPLEEEREHILNDGICNCVPDVKTTTGGSMIVHKKTGKKEPRRMHAHWIQ